MSRYYRSPCCGAVVSVPVDVTAHLRVTRLGGISARLTDTFASLRRAALMGDADLAEAYCEECGAAVSVIQGTEADDVRV